MSSFDVVGVGLNATDTLLLLSRFPAYAGKVPFETEILGVSLMVEPTFSSALPAKAFFESGLAKSPETLIWTIGPSTSSFA